MPLRRVKIVERKLGRRNAHGLAHFDKPLIEIDDRLRGKKQQEILLHELLHVAFPHLDEEAVTEAASWMAEYTWKFGLRRIQQ